MANYTVELRRIIESGVNIFDFPYEFYNEEKRKEFENKFIKHFYFREIGCETVERFKWFLEDKMVTVFPYYNELFKSASIEYDVLDNYKLTETYTRNVENTNKQSGITSTVGQSIIDGQRETKESKHTQSNGAFESTVTETGSETTNTSSTNNETVTDNGTKQSTGTQSTNSTADKKTLDTPQGMVNLNDTRYITALEQDTTTATQTNEGSETITDKKTASGTSETETENKSNKSNSVEQSTTGEESATDYITDLSKNEQKTTADSNTRLYNDGQQNETYTLTRRGNIGVDTDSDAIEKHNRLQRTLKKIELMFFEECEDLFMLVY